MRGVFTRQWAQAAAVARRVRVTTADRRKTQPGRRRARRGGRRAKDRPGHHPILLVADSHQDTRVESARYLNDCEFRVLEATNGEEALAVIRATPPHMILMELTLPQMPAWRLPSWLAHSSRTRDIPVIVLNPTIVVASDFEGKAAAPILYRPTGMLVKPFPLAAMLEEVRRVLRTRGARGN